MTTLKLYYVRADEQGGDPLDLFVRASSLEDAALMWNDYYKDFDGEIYSIREVPPVEGPPGAINWENV